MEIVAHMGRSRHVGTPRGVPDIHGGDGFDVLDGNARVLGDSELQSAHAGAMGVTLVWEVSRGGQLFPHAYGATPLSAVVSTEGRLNGVHD